jgi:putative ABC transport system permease protein
MLRNYFITAWRNLWKNKVFSAINIFGLSIGIAAFLLIANYLRFEYSYDDFHVNNSRLFRVPMKIAEKDGKEQTFAFTYPAVAPALKKDFPEIEETVRFRKQWGVIKRGDIKLVENQGTFFVDPSVFKMFSFEFLQGNAATALRDLNDVVLTESTAKKYFGKEDPIGKSISYRNEDYVVKAILKDPPGNSHLRFNFLFHYQKYVQYAKSFGSDAERSWGWSDFYTYILLKPGTSPDAVAAKLPAFTERYLGTEMKQRGYHLNFVLQPVKDIHLRSVYDYELDGNGNFTYLKYLAIAAFFILFIAWINYINLSTAKSFDRSKEVGLRKVIGANKFQLVRQFLAESTLLNLMAIILAVLIMKASLPFFSSLVEKQVDDLSATGWKFWIFALGISILGSLLAAFYPAFVLSSFRPIQALRSSASGSSAHNKNFLRKFLVIVQFTAAIVLIAGAIGYYSQLRFMSTRELGVDIDQTLVLNQNVSQDSSSLHSIQSFINDLESNPAIQTVTASTSVPGGEVGGSSSFTLQNSLSEKRCRDFGVDNKFIDAYGLSIVAGRAFTNDLPATDTSRLLNVVLNETAVKVFGFATPQAAIGQLIKGAGFRCKIIGVVKDYHQESLKQSFDPIVFYPDQEINFGNYSIKYSASDPTAMVSFVKEKWNARFPESPFQFFFLDQYFNEQYKTDRLFATVLSLFTVLAIIIASLGLFGLSLYTISKRNKEISIRKVLGATVMEITTLVTKDYMRLVLIAGIVAVPIAWWLLQSWLQDYAFHISIGWWFFLLPLALISMIALLTVLYQSVRAAIANPVKSLRAE